MRLATLLAVCLMFANVGSTMAAGAAPSGGDNPTSKTYISNLRLGGWIGNDPLLVLPDRTAGATPLGGGFAGVKLLEIGDNSFTVEYNGTKGKMTTDPVWELAPHPDLTNWLINYMKDAGLKIDAQTPDISQQGMIHIMHSGAITTDFLKVQQASPLQALPYWMESIDLKVVINPHDPTKVAFVSMKVTPQAYERLMKSLYSVPATTKPAN